jgi:SAM-dependent methyltransferase
MDNDLGFSKDLYRGSAGYYDKYRLPYPDALIADLIGRTAPSGRGRLLDLACGTGQLAFPLSGFFAESWAVDQEPDMVEVVRAKAAAGGAAGARIHPVVASAEELDVAPAAFEVAVIGNAFHRLRRGEVAARVRRCLQPGGYLALCWSFAPWNGTQDWQRAFDQLLQRWRTALSGNRIPGRAAQDRRELPDAELLFEYGFEMVGRYEFVADKSWTVPDLAGLIRSTSFLPQSVLQSHGATFDAELAAALGPYSSNGLLTETVQFAYELARKPG